MEISEVIVYFIKVMIIQGVFFAFYWLALRNQPSHSLNRVYLLCALLLSLVIPFMENPFPEKAEPILEITMLEWMAEPMGLMEPDSETVSNSSGFPMWSLLSWVYLALVLFFVARSSFHLYLLQKIKKQCEYVKKHWFKLFKTTHSRPFSFFSSVFIPNSVFGSSAFDQILAHECVHVRQLHSLDRLLVDLLVSLFWFNPFIFLYRKALIEVHEYQADAEVIKQYDDVIGYQEILFAQLQPAPYSGLVSHFNFSTIKKRIVMMNKSKTYGQSRLAYLLTMPVLAMVLFAFSTKESKESVDHITHKIEQLTGPFNALPLPSIQEDNFRPSILPLKTDARFKVSSGFGLRKDPIGGGMKKHKGMDFAVTVGTEVVATADGVVQETEDMKESHGKIVVLLHGDKFLTRYAQLSEFMVKKGDQVKKGQVIALSGNSGRSTGPHLHYEVYEDSKFVDPMDYIKNYKFASLNDSNEKLRKIAQSEKLMEEAELDMAKATAEMKIAASEERTAREELQEAQVTAEYAFAQMNQGKQIVEKVSVELSDEKKKPLIILDGEVFDHDEMEDLDSQRIEQVEVLKGEAALDKYGEEGKNGVIVITTKLDNQKNKKKPKYKNKDKNKMK